ncbi:MAG: MBOAT family O-acyltransferase [Synergistaceae bacterium]|nr:MBOAT family O-acyltransferase [Synergistaceae bacterium]
MVFSSTVFLFIFLPLVLAIYYNPIFKSRAFKNIFLLIASLVFYAWGEPIFVFLMIFSIVITWFLGLKIANSNSKTVLTLGISYHILILFVFKYLSFFAQQLGLLLNKDWSVVSIALPIGISFFTFQLMSYLFDVYYKKAEVQKNLLYLGLYVSLFPQLIAGPIVRYEQIALAITDRHETYDDIVIGIQRFTYGLAKKVLLANYLAQIADNLFDYMVGNTSVAMAWLGAICYTLQVYFDFSGYSDMAIGLGRMFGFHFTENFNYPYISKSVTEFWKRWHISLSTWFRDYVYIPLGGNRVSKPRWIFNLFIIWLFTGIWHGANWTYIVWGLIYFIVLLAEKFTGYTGKSKYFSHVYTMLVLILAEVIFRANTMSEAVIYLGNMFGVGTTSVIDSAFIIYIKSTASVLLFSIIGTTPCFKNIMTRLKQTRFYMIETLWVTLLFMLSLLQVVSSTYNPFIYFNF